jgi:hypothetical protein
MPIIRDCARYVEDILLLVAGQWQDCVLIYTSGIVSSQKLENSKPFDVSDLLNSVISYALCLVMPNVNACNV